MTRHICDIFYKIKEKPIFITLTQNSGIRVKDKSIRGIRLAFIICTEYYGVVTANIILIINFGHIDTDK